MKTDKDFYIKEHLVGTIRIIGACDRELLGKVIKDETGLEINVNEKFYGGMLVDKEDLMGTIKNANSVNLIGNRVVKAVLENGFGRAESVKKIGGVMFMMVIHI
ncbi:MAG: DUF424 family protein [Thermoproteota archaeon]